jgi:hypothetical protein
MLVMQRLLSVLRLLQLQCMIAHVLRLEIQARLGHPGGSSKSPAALSGQVRQVHCLEVPGRVGKQPAARRLDMQTPAHRCTDMDTELSFNDCSCRLLHNYEYSIGTRCTVTSRCRAMPHNSLPPDNEHAGSCALHANKLCIVVLKCKLKFYRVGS